MLVLIVCLPEGVQEVYLVGLTHYPSNHELGSPKRYELLQIDRTEQFYGQQGLFFPHQDGPDSMHSNVVLDGELVIDTDPKTGQVSLNAVEYIMPADISGSAPTLLAGFRLYGRGRTEPHAEISCQSVRGTSIYLCSYSHSLQRLLSFSG